MGGRGKWVVGAADGCMVPVGTSGYQQAGSYIYLPLGHRFIV